MTSLTFSDYSARLGEFIESASAPGGGVQELWNPAAPEDERTPMQPRLDGIIQTHSERVLSQLALVLFELQFAFNLPYRRVCQAREVSPAAVTHWGQIPAMPTSAFKELELTSLAPAERRVVFHSSGTTEQRPSRHFHNAESLKVYEASLLAWYRAHLPEDLPLIFLTPSPKLAPHSSLVYMFDAVRRRVGASGSTYTGSVDAGGAWLLDMKRASRALWESVDAKRPVALLGTAFNFVHVLDDLIESGMRLGLPAGSWVLETGGYKGRSRDLPKAELHSLITEYLGIPSERIVCEYGMSELSSQAYDWKVQSNVQCPMSNAQCPEGQTQGRGRVFRFPPWARVQVISPETGREVDEGETGLLRVFDLANVRSVLAIQTEDLGVRRGTGFELVGRARRAEPRGCSLMVA